MRNSLGDRRQFEFEIELFACCYATGMFTAENGAVTHIALEDGTEFSASSLSGWPTISSGAFKRAIAVECLRQIETKPFYQDMLEQTLAEAAPYSAPIRLGQHGL